jgi:hypothetical protein
MDAFDRKKYLNNNKLSQKEQSEEKAEEETIFFEEKIDSETKNGNDILKMISEKISRNIGINVNITGKVKIVFGIEK